MYNVLFFMASCVIYATHPTAAYVIDGESELEKPGDTQTVNANITDKAKEEAQEKNRLKEDYNKMAEEYLKPQKMRGNGVHQRKDLPQKIMAYDVTNHRAEQDKAVNDQNNVNISHKYLNDPSRMIKNKIFQPSEGVKFERNKYQDLIDGMRAVD